MPFIKGIAKERSAGDTAKPVLRGGSKSIIKATVKEKSPFDKEQPPPHSSDSI
jgi:hypothetical protein